MKKLHCLFVIVLLSIPGSLVIAQNLSPQQISEIENTINEEMNITGVPGVALAIINDKQVVFEKGFGLANTLTGLPMSESTIFQIASVTKTFTALTILKELKEAHIDVHQSIGTVIKGLSPSLSSITFHQLLSHKGGLIEYTNESDGTDIYDFFRNIGDSILFIEPGRLFSYSNMGYALLDLAIQRLSGLTYPEAVDRDVFVPLKLKNTGYYLYEVASKSFAPGHIWSDGKLTPKINHFDLPLLRAAGGLFSNLQDLERLVLCFMNNGILEGEQVIDPDIIDQMCQPYSKDFMASGSSYVVHYNWTDNAYGYGIWMFNYGEHRFFVTAGGGNHLTYFIYDPEAGFSMIMNSNRAWQGLYDSFIKIFEVVLGQENPSKNDIEVNEKESEEITGTYYRPAIRTDQFPTIVISEKDEKLYIKFNNSGDSELEQIGNLEYKYSSPYLRYPAAINFQKDESGNITYLLYVWRAYLKKD
ncbi:MAG: serine hydrolase domain-containing protein [Bacteroidota bacterium]